MSDLLTGYNHCLTILEDIPLFNTESFIENKPKSHRKFYTDFTATQIFLQFLQTDNKENFPYFHKIDQINKNHLNQNSRKNTYIQKTADLDISKYFHLNGNSSRGSVASMDKYLVESLRANSLGNASLQDKKESKKEKEKTGASNSNKDKRNSDTFSMNNLNFNSEKKLNFIIDDNYLCNFKEIYYLFPYFHEINCNAMMKNDYLKDYNYFVALMNKYFDEEILKEREGKIILKSHNLINKKIDFAEKDKEIKEVTERVFEDFRFLDFEKFPKKFLRYSLPNYNPPPVKKANKRHSSIVYEIEKRIENQKIQSDLQGRKTLSIGM